MPLLCYCKVMKSKKKLIIVVIIILILSTLGYVGLQQYKSSECFDIVGDGYAMGTDPEPVVIGNSCDL